MKKSKLIIAYTSMFLAIVTALFIINISNHDHQEEGEHGYDELVTQLRYSTFEEFEVKKEEKATFVLFVGQDGCGACEDLLPTLFDISDGNEIRQNVYYMDIEGSNNTLIKTDYGIVATPTLLFVKDGKIVDRLEGSAGEDNDRKLLKDRFKHLNFV